jgi:hypothetical protein
MSSNPDLPMDWWTDPRVASLTTAAFKVHVLATMWCWQHNSDGELPFGALRFLGEDGSRRRVLDRLVASGLWQQQDAGYVLTDYLDHQPSAAKRLGWRAGARDRQARHRGRQ